MTDRELLEMAAEAVGHVATDGFGECHDMNRNEPWDPLVDDGDALRLAVKLLMTVETCATYAQAISPDGIVSRVLAKDVDDPHAATRRAIVLAAANIGKAKP